MESFYWESAVRNSEVTSPLLKRVYYTTNISVLSSEYSLDMAPLCVEINLTLG